MEQFWKIDKANTSKPLAILWNMFQVSCQNIEYFSRNSYFQVGGLHVSVRVLIIVCATIKQHNVNHLHHLLPVSFYYALSYHHASVVEEMQVLRRRYSNASVVLLVLQEIDDS